MQITVVQSGLYVTAVSTTIIGIHTYTVCAKPNLPIYIYIYIYYIYIWPLLCIHQWPSFKVNPSYTKFPGSGTEIIPGKHSDTRIKPLPLTNGHGRYMAVTPERTLVSVGECPLNI
jgi:hypothetical protein